MKESFADELLSEIRHQLEAVLPALADQLLPAGRELLIEQAEQLESWAAQAAAGQLTEEDVEWLVRSRLDLTRLKALESAGMAQVEIDLFRQTLARTAMGMLIGRIAS